MKINIISIIIISCIVLIIIIIIFIIKKNTISNFENKKISKKPKFQYTLENCKYVLDNINVPFHLHSGTALGVIREGDFISHDNDIDIGIFKEDYKDNIIEKMNENNFKFITQFGNIEDGLEYKFVNTKYEVSLDIFFIYREKDKMHQSVFHCDDKNNKYKKGKTDNECILYMNTYKPELINLFGKEYYTAPISFLEDRYGKDWKIPKKFGYFDGIKDGNYKSVETYENNNIFIYWVGKEYKLIEIFRDIIFKYSKKGNGYTVHYITNKNLNKYIKDIPTYFNDLLPAHQADFIRVNVICDYGGIWLDSDILIMDKLDSLFDIFKDNEGFFIKSNNDKISNAVFGSKKNTKLMDDWKKSIKYTLDTKQNKISWTEIGSDYLNKNNIQKYFQNYKIFNGLENMFPVFYKNSIDEFIKKPYINYKNIIKEYQPLIGFDNALYKYVEKFSKEEIINGTDMPISYFVNKSFL